MKLAIASPSSSSYSETFIRMQMEQLPASVRIHGGPVPNETVPGGPIQPYTGLFNLARSFITTRAMPSRKSLPYTRELVKRLHEERVECILANYGPCGVSLLEARRTLSVPLIVHFHGYDAHQKSTQQSFQEDYLRLANEAHAVVAVSHKMSDCLSSLGFPEEKIHVIRCGVDAPRFHEREGVPAVPQFFGVGRFVDKKAPYLTLVSFSKVLETIPNAKLVIAGDGPLLETTINLSKAMNLEHAVSLPGVISPDEVAKFLRSSTAFVQHSIVPTHGASAGDSEGTPVAVMEAMLSGVPVISTRHAGIAEIIDEGKSGILVDERDCNGMADAMCELANDNEKCRSMGAAARAAAVKNHLSDDYIGALRELIQRSISEPRT